MNSNEIVDFLGKDLSKIKLIIDSCFDIGRNDELGQRVSTINHELFKYYRDSVSAENNKENEGMDENGFPTRITTPDSVVAEQSEKLMGFLCDSFLINDPIFNVPSIPNQSRLTSAVGDYITKMSNINRWRLPLQKCIQNAIWYNLSGSETYIEDGGIKIKSIKPVNLIYQQGVPVDEIIDKGSFYGYEERLNVSSAYAILAGNQGLTSKGKELANEGILKIFTQKWKVSDNQIQTVGSKYETNCRHKHSFEGEIDFSAFMSEAEQKKHSPITDIVMRVIYKRLDKSWVNTDSINKGIIDSSQLPLYRLVTFNGIPVIIEDVTDGSKVMTFGTLYTDSEESLPLSHAERLVPVQTYNAKLQASRIIAIRKLLEDSYIVNESFVEVEGSVKRIKSNAIVDKTLPISHFYQQDRKDYNELNTLLGGLGEVQDFADKISGNNPALSGQHVVGNRTAVESQRLVSSAESRFNLRKLMLQQTLFEPMQRSILKMCKLNRTSIRYFDPVKEQLASPTETELSMVSYFLDIGDGGLPSSDITSPEAIQALMVMATQQQQVAQRFDAGDLFKQFALALNFKRINEVRMPHDPSNELGAEANTQLQQQPTLQGQPTLQDQGGQGGQVAQVAQGGQAVQTPTEGQPNAGQ